MRANVLNDPALVKHAGQLAWLSIDTEKPQNAAFLEKFSVESWPTFYVVEPKSQSPVLIWLGSATAEQLEKLIADGERAARLPAGDSPEVLLARADRANAEGRSQEAVTLYLEAVERGGSSWQRRPRAVESTVVTLQKSREFKRCAEVARREGSALRAGPSQANVVVTGLACALRAPADADWRQPALKALEPMVRAALDSPGLLADDRSGLYAALIQLKEGVHDAAAVKQLASQWLRFLEESAASAQSTEARAAFDSHRLEAAIKLGDPARAIGPLEASERELPEDYNPPNRLAIAYRELGRYEEALAASKRALAKAYGPRRIRVLETQASIYQKRGDFEGAKRTLEEAIQYANSLPPAQRSELALKRLGAALTKVGQNP